MSERVAAYADILGRIEQSQEAIAAALGVLAVEVPRLSTLLTELAITMATHDSANVQMVLRELSRQVERLEEGQA